MRVFRRAFIALAVVLALGLNAPLQARPPERAAYSGVVAHIFFHSLVAYPELAFGRDAGGSSDYKTDMITRDQFVRILGALEARNYMLIAPHDLYATGKDGRVAAKTLYLPAGRTPLIISLDDLNYYAKLAGHGFADKLVLDADGNVATEIADPDGKVLITRTGDAVPILDDFVASHPDFSLDGAKGTIAVTGFEGVLGYRTEARNRSGRAAEIAAAIPVIERLKLTGWTFASHSFSHGPSLKDGAISLAGFEADLARWNDEVEPLVGPTDVYIGPFGQVFANGDPRRQAIIRSGFRLLCGVGVKPYLHYYPNYVAMDRVNIDGYRLDFTPRLLAPYFDVAEIGSRGSIDGIAIRSGSGPGRIGVRPGRFAGAGKVPGSAITKHPRTNSRPATLIDLLFGN